MPKPEVVKTLPKFDGRSTPGILVGYHLQPGGLWKGEFQVSPKSKFEDFDWERPRNLKELIPIRTLEAELTDKVPQYMMKEGYDAQRRCLKNPFAVQEEAAVPAPGPEEPPQDFDDDDDDPDAVLRAHPLFCEFKFDSKGRKYAYHVFGSRTNPTGITKQGRPNTCSPIEWRHMAAADEGDDSSLSCRSG